MLIGSACCCWLPVGNGFPADDRRTDSELACRHGQTGGHEVSSVQDSHACSGRYHPQPAGRNGRGCSLCRSVMRRIEHLAGQRHCRSPWNSHTERTRSSHYLYANESRTQFQVEVVSHWLIERSRRACWSIGRIVISLVTDARPALHAGFRSWS